MKLQKRLYFLGIFLTLIFIIILIVFYRSKLSYAHNEFFLYVSNSGSDESGDGSENAPFQTLDKAMENIQDNTTIYVREGTYTFYKSIKLENKNNITIKPYKNEEVVFTTVHKLPLSDKYKCDEYFDENNNVTHCIDLNKYVEDEENLDFVIKNYIKEYKTAEFFNKFYRINHERVNHIKLYFKDQELNVARYPNDNKYLTIDEVDESSNTDTFYINNLSNKDWINSYSYQNNKLYSFGYYSWDWVTDYNIVKLTEEEDRVKVVLKDNINANKKYWGTEKIKQGQRIAFYNIFEELDINNEYYFYRNTKENKNINQLYLVLDGEISNDDFIEYTFEYEFDKNNLQPREEDNSLFYIYGSNNILFENIKFEKILGNVIWGTPIYDEKANLGISAPLKNITIQNCEFEDINGKVIYLKDGTENLIKNNYFNNLGENAIKLADSQRFRPSLTIQNNKILNNKIENFDINNFLNVAIEINGVGNTIAHNEINNSGVGAIRHYGNNNIIEFNEIYNVGEKTGDAAAIYGGGDLAKAGNIVRNNYIHDIDNSEIVNDILAGEDLYNKTYSGVFGVYADDNEANLIVKNNVFSRMKGAYNVNGGNNNVFINNILNDVRTGVTHYEPTYIKERAVNSYMIDRLYNLINSPYYDAEKWGSQFPNIKSEVLDKAIEIQNSNGNIKEYVKKYLLPTRGMIIKNNLALSSSDYAQINSCDDILKKDINGNNVGVNIPVGAALNRFRIDGNYNDNIGENFRGRYKADDNDFEISGGICNYNKYQNFYYGFQDSYNVEKEAVEDYKNDNFNLNLEYIKKNYLTDFEEIHFNRMGKNKVIKLEVENDNFKKKYIQNYDALDLSQGTLKVYYSSDEVKTISMNKANVTGFDNKILGTQTLALNYMGEKINIDVEIIKKSIVGIELINKPNKLKYFKNSNNIDLTGGILQVTYNDKTTEQLDIKDVKISGFNSENIGTNKITVEYNNHFAYFDIEIIDVKIESISMSQLPTKTEYIQNYEKLDLVGALLQIKYSNGETELINLTDPRVEISGFNNSTLGKNTINIKIGKISTTFTINIVSKNINKIEISKKPTKVKYYQNEKLDLTNGIIKVYYNDKTTDYLSMKNSLVTASGFNSKTLGNKEIVVTYQGKKTSFKIEVVELKIKEIKISELPLKNTYFLNENLDLTGGILEIKYENNSVSQVSLDNNNIKISGFDNQIIGKQTIKVTYLDLETQFLIETIEKEIINIKILKLPTKLKYLQYFEVMDLTDGVLEITYNDKTTDKISLTNENIIVSGFNNAKLGTNTIIVEYKKFTTSFDVTIAEQESNIILNNYYDNYYDNYLIKIIIIIIESILLLAPIIISIYNYRKNKLSIK